LTIKYFDDKIVTFAECVINEMKKRSYKSYHSVIDGYEIKVKRIEEVKKNEQK